MILTRRLEAVLIDVMSFIRGQCLDTRVKELKAPSLTSHILDLARKVNKSIVSSVKLLTIATSKHSISVNWVMYNKLID